MSYKKESPFLRATIERYINPLQNNNNNNIDMIGITEYLLQVIIY